MILGISRSAYYYKPGQTDDERDLAVLKAILDVLGRRPFYGYRKVARELEELGVTRKQVRRIMKRAGLRAIYPGKRTSMPAKQHKKYPYLLRGKAIWLPNQVWAKEGESRRAAIDEGQIKAGEKAKVGIIPSGIN